MTKLTMPRLGTVKPLIEPVASTVTAVSSISDLLSVNHAFADAALTPEMVRGTALVPWLITTTASLPSEFTKAVDLRLLSPPARPTRTAPGRTLRLYWAKAQSRLETT